MCYVIWGADIYRSPRRSPLNGADTAVGHSEAVKLATPLLLKMKELSAIKVPEARLAALLRSPGDCPPVGTSSCPLRIGLRVQVCASERPVTCLQFVCGVPL